MLSELFPKENIPYETIVCTVNKFPNSAVIGIIRKNDEIFLKVFSETKTARNIKNNKSFSINLVDNLEIFVDSALKFNSLEYDFINKIPILKKAKCYIICTVKKLKEKKITDDIGRAKILLINAFAREIVMKEKIRAFSRIENAIIEGLVHATRYKIKKRKREKDFIEYYLKLAEKDKQNKKLTKKIRKFIELSYSSCSNYNRI